MGDPFDGAVETGSARSNGSLEVDDEVEHPGALGDDDIAGDWAEEGVVGDDSVAENKIILYYPTSSSKIARFRNYFCLRLRAILRNDEAI